MMTVKDSVLTAPAHDADSQYGRRRDGKRQTRTDQRSLILCDNMRLYFTLTHDITVDIYAASTTEMRR